MATQVYAACIARTLEKYDIIQYTLHNSERYVDLGLDDFNKLKNELGKKEEKSREEGGLVALIKYWGWTFKAKVPTNHGH